MSDLENWQERLQSPVDTYNISKPMPIDEFERLPQDLQREYLQRLRRAYGFGTSLAAAMLGVTKDAFVALATSLGVPWPKTLILLRVEAIASARAKFLAGYEFPAPPEPEPVAILPEDRSRDDGGCAAASSPTAELTALRVELCGTIPAIIPRLQSCAAAFGDLIFRVTVEVET